MGDQGDHSAEATDNARPAPDAPLAYRDALATGVGASLFAGWLVAGIDAAVTLGRAGGGAALVAIVFGLYALPSVAIGLLVGAVAGAFSRTFGRGALAAAARRLGRDADADRRATAAVLAGAVALGTLAVAVALLAPGLVGNVQRKEVGALLLGLGIAALVPAIALCALPWYRLWLRVAPAVPRSARVPSAAVAAFALVALGISAVLAAVFALLEWRALALSSWGLAALYPIAMLAWVALLHGPGARLRDRIPRRGALAAAVALVAVALAALTLRGEPPPMVLRALIDQSLGARVLIGAGRAAVDRDGDGYSPFLGGPDCDDDNADIHPTAAEIPGNGVDENCIGGDGVSGSEGAGASQAPSPLVEDFAFDGNLLFILVDTVRADRMGYAGYRRDGASLTPAVDRLAATSAVFDRVWAQASNTPRSWPSMMASRYPTQVAVETRFHNFAPLLDDNLLLAEVLASAGIETLHFSSHFYFDERRNADQGFDVYDNRGALDIRASATDIAAPRVVPGVLEALEQRAASPRRFALFVHLFEPHASYVEHDAYPVSAGGGAAGLAARYDYEIKYADDQVGAILATLREAGLDDDTMVVVVSDHGEAFGSHRVAGQALFFHGRTLYDEVLRVPLVIRLPGVEPSRIDDPVALVDLAPTIAEAMGVDVPASFVGRSLLARMLGAPLAPRPILAQLLPTPMWNRAAAALVTADGRYKIIYDMSEKRFELYDLESDPGELDNLYDESSELSLRLRHELVRRL